MTLQDTNLRQGFLPGAERIDYDAPDAKDSAGCGATTGP